MPLHEDPSVLELIHLAKREDLGAGDITSKLLPDGRTPARFQLLAKAGGVFAGRQVADAILAAYDPGILIDWETSCVDGWSWPQTPAVLATLSGPLGSILTAERVFLNFLQRLCGVATRTRAFVEAVKGTGAKIYDTRKTTPGWRTLEKYAVRCGGGENHRCGLYDAVLIKDNHVAGVPDQRIGYAVFEMLNRLESTSTAVFESSEARESARATPPVARRPFVQVECASLSQLEPLLAVVGIDSILLDNFRMDDLRQAVVMREDLGLAARVTFEASGGIALENVRQVAETGVERISIGAITHSALAVDLSLERV